MIEKLNIENFMLFEKLEIPTLKRVNLIGGRNNSGKTTFLDALRLLFSEGDAGIVNHILENRQLYIASKKDRYEGLFNRQLLDFNKKENHVIINDLQIERLINNGIFFNANNKLIQRHRIGLSKDSIPTTIEEKCVNIPFNSDFNMLSNLWEKIVLTPEEDDVLDIIKETIEPKLRRFDVGKSKVRIRLTNTVKPVPLGTLGDGVQRILLMALSLANAKNSYLLIDEIELGLHHSVLEKLWKMIFKYAKKWNIQVFVTTHSQDALRTFTYVASEEENQKEAQFIRLQIGRTGKNEAILFDIDRLRTTLELALEIR